MLLGGVYEEEKNGVHLPRGYQVQAVSLIHKGN